MKIFAITPDDFDAARLTAALPELHSRGVTHVYIRSAMKQDIGEMLSATVASCIVPVIPYRLYRHHMRTTCGVHFKSNELSLLAQHAPEDALVITASSHGSVDARLALQAGARFVLVSPVFKPISKPTDSRQLFPRDELRKLIAAHGEKIVLLGGLTEQRLRDLRRDMDGDFSIAGISFFFDPDCSQES